MMFSAIALLAVMGSASALPRATVDLGASVTSILNATDGHHRFPKMPDLSHMKLRTVDHRVNWDWSDCSRPGNIVTIRSIDVQPCVAPRLTLP